MFQRSPAWIWKGIQKCLQFWWRSVFMDNIMERSWTYYFILYPLAQVIIVVGLSFWNFGTTAAWNKCEISRSRWSLPIPGGWISLSYIFQKNNSRKEACHNSQQSSSGSKIAAALHSGMTVLQNYSTGKAWLYL